MNKPKNSNSNNQKLSQSGILSRNKRGYSSKDGILCPANLSRVSRSGTTIQEKDRARLKNHKSKSVSFCSNNNHIGGTDESNKLCKATESARLDHYPQPKKFYETVHGGCNRQRGTGKSDLQCICQICICGKHRCPLKTHRGPSGFGPDVVSEYKKTYVPHKIEPVEPFTPKYQPLDEGDLSDLTTHRLDYKPHDVNKPVQRQPDVYQPPEEPLDSTTMYKQHFTPKEIDVRRPVREIPRMEPAEFEGRPTYRSDFREWPMQQISRWKPDAYTPNADDFEGITSYNQEYKPYNEKPPESFKPAYVAPTDVEPMSSATDYRQTYVEHPLEPRQPIKKEVWAKPTCEMDSVTTNRRDYTPKDIEVRSSCKPNVNPFLSDEPLSDITTQRRDYQPWDREKPERHVPDPYVAPEGELATDTTYRNDYHPYPDADKTKPVEHIERRDIAAPFEDATNYKTDYKDWNAPKPDLVKDGSRWSPPSEPLDDKTTHRVTYIPHLNQTPVQSCKPPISVLAGEPGDINASTYRHDYVDRSIICPVLKLHTPAAEFTFMYEGDDGHLYYQPIYVTLSNSNSNALTRVPIEKNSQGEMVFKIPGSSIENVIVAES